ncbi:uncharacterized protein BDW70DRAFT_125550 [Aspergillus foveolatus]|uniref:uncharacterized protein n=1 Tax=Aspergillus foveolatus TaxID=210207 RepID=UPI003CCD5C13
MLLSPVQGWHLFYCGFRDAVTSSCLYPDSMLGLWLSEVSAWARSAMVSRYLLKGLRTDFCGHCAFRIREFRQSAGSHGHNKDVNLQGYWPL